MADKGHGTAHGNGGDADAGAALGALPAEALCVALVDGAAHYSVRALVDGDEASRAAAWRWRGVNGLAPTCGSISMASCAIFGLQAPRIR